MSIPSVVEAQRDFTGGQINEALKRSDDVELMKTGGRKMLNFRPEATRTMVPRPGRRALFQAAGTRVEYFRMTPANEFMISFSAGAYTITDLLGNVVSANASATYLWSAATLGEINWCVAVYDLVICFPGMRPQIIAWNIQNNTWSTGQFTFRYLNNASQEPFYRFSVPGATMTPGALTGITSLVCSQNYFTDALIGSRLSIAGQQCEITAHTDAQNATISIDNQLPQWVVWNVSNTAPFLPGMIVQDTLGNKAEVGIVTAGTSVAGTLLNSIQPAVVGVPPVTVPPATLISAIGSAQYTDFETTMTPQPTQQWSEEFMGAVHGWPAACFYDLSRLGFCDFAQMPEAILWSSVGIPDIFWIDAVAVETTQSAGANPNNAILEFAPNKCRVRNVVYQGDDFVFTDKGIFYIPISASVGGAALAPGSVQFIGITRDGCSPIKPVSMLDLILYVNAGLTRVSMIVKTGSYTTPYAAQDTTDAHSNLFNAPVTLAAATGDSTYPERYIYVVNSDGSVAVGRVVRNGDKQIVGWVPWKGSASTQWVTIANAQVYYTSLYGAAPIVETEDANYFLDGLVFPNSPYAPLVQGGKGPAWWFAGGTVTLMDGNLDMGDRAVDANGNIIALQDDVLTSPTLVAGSFSQAVFQPFLPNVPSGEDHRQRQRRRRISRVSVTVENSSGFTLAKRPIAPYNFGDDATQPPPLRNKTYDRRLVGRRFDPDPPSLVKDRPGPLRIVEFSQEATI